MTTTDEKTASPYGELTDQAVQRSRQRLGVPQPQHNPPHNYEVTADGARHFAYGYGDDNPLYCDPSYGPRTRWGTLVAPPTFLYTMGEDAAPTQDAETKALLKGDPFAGLGSYQAVMEFEWWNPLVLGDRCHVLQAQVGVRVKPSSFGGRTAHVTHDYLYANGAGQMHALRRGTWINAERHTSKNRAKEKLEQQPYTPAEIAEIDAAYAAETRRGAEPRYFDDVKIGDTLQPRVKGPLTTTDVVVWHLGWGMQLTPPGAFKIAANIRRKAPGLYPPNDLNIPDTVQRLHWEPVRAQELGLPNSYDYGGMRETWLCHLITDWIGDDGWLWKLRCEHRKFNYIGDTTWVRGKVTDKQTVSGRNEVHLEVWCENQRGETSTPGTAVVLLPTRAEAARLPEPPAATLQGMVEHELATFRQDI
ncbi:FAS1-like dehydratase domain-containing protein [Rhodococcus opacus]|uniref:FAS1-like dehydratase domain-containing protein n=1 Tax=Rhodococcus opacus TaxID=37919 RepID=UPI001C4573A0|nr:MaoC family dehydratase N-terminal domain-containing protein [Rhodococcus opacus]MBV6756201.1 MaoC family dehydratase N-terminal domain-containing protein [Rhodococcus opacus]